MVPILDNAAGLVTYGLPALIVSASSRYRAPASGAQPFAFACGGVSLRVCERGKEPGKNEPPSPSSPRPVQRLEIAFRIQQDDGGLPYGHRWSFRLQAPERREGTLLLGRPFAAPLCPCGRLPFGGGRFVIISQIVYSGS